MLFHHLSATFKPHEYFKNWKNSDEIQQTFIIYNMYYEFLL